MAITVRQVIQSCLSLGGAIACAFLIHAPASVQTIPMGHPDLPDTVSETIRDTFQKTYQNRLANIHITEVTPVVWQDCPPNAQNRVSENRVSDQSCELSPQNGWRVAVTGEFPTIHQQITRVYYSDRRGFAVMDGPGSLSDEARSQLARQLNQAASSLAIKAVQEQSFLPATACPPTGFCPIPPLGLSWRVLVQESDAERIVHVSSLGTPLYTEESSAYFSEGDRPRLGTLPLALANAVVRDAQERLATGEIFPVPYPSEGVEIEFRVDSIRAIDWNLCRGGTGPSRPSVGTCPNVQQSGWQLIVVGGIKQQPFRLVYYIPTGSIPDTLQTQPDGLQSLPDVVLTQILRRAANQIGVPVSRLRLHWAESRLFDGCLNTNPQLIHCRNDIRPGWRIELMEESSSTSSNLENTNEQIEKQLGGQMRWIYHTNLTGMDIRLVDQGEWMPPPVVQPVQPL